MDWLILLLGLSLLIGGGEVLVRGSTSLAKSLGVSPLVIGLTVVAFGTSAPELAVNLTAALRGQGGISFGNIIGSNIANIGLILGLAALVRPLHVRREIIVREMPILLAVTFAACLMAMDSLLNQGATNQIGGMEGGFLLIGFACFMAYTLRMARRDRRSSGYLNIDAGGKGRPMSLVTALLLTLAGLAGVIGGGHWTVEGAVALARSFGVSEAVIGLSIVALGTSLPELVTSVAAARSGHADLAVGNVVGSNLFNLLLVLGSTAIVRPVPFPERGAVDLAVMLGMSILLLPMAMTFQRRISRVEGAVLLVAYCTYIAWRTLG